MLKPTVPVPQSLITHTDVACPFCGLLCDDLTIRSEGRALVPIANACPKAQAAYAGAGDGGMPRVRGKPVSLAQAIDAAQRLLRRARRPLIAGLGTDVAGLRAAFALAERCHALIDHMHSAALNLNLRVLQARGWQTTTLSEVRNRADLVVLVGVDVQANFQNFVARLLAPAETLQPARRAARRLAYVGPAAQAPAATAGIPLDVVACGKDDLASSVRALQGLVAGRRLELPRGKLRTALTALATRVSAAEYPVFVWAPGQLAPTTGDQVIAGICDLVTELNRTRRAAGLVLGGDDGAQSALAVSTWLTGFAGNVSFAGERIEASADASAARQLADGAIDLLIHVSSFSRREVPATAVPTIVLAPPGFSGGAEPTVYLPVGIPGLDHAGQLLRTDGVVALPLRQLRSPEWPSVAELLERLGVEPAPR